MKSEWKGRRLRWAVLSVILFVVFAAAAQAPAQAQEKRPMTFMDVMEMRAVGAGSLSPDGQNVIYTISIPQWKVGKNFTDIFAGPANGDHPVRRMTFTAQKNETQPQWARDSRTFGFLSDRDGPNQLFLMRVDGGEARKLSDAKDGVNAYAFSRDAKWVAFSAGKAEERQIWIAPMDGEGPPVQLTKHATPVTSFEWSPDSSRIFFLSPDRADKDDQQRREKKFDVRIMDPERAPVHLWSIGIADHAEKRWTSGDAYSVLQFTIALDSSRVAFRSASNDRHANALEQVDSEIYTLDLSSGQVTRLTTNKVAEGMPRFSPDSKWLAFTAPDEFAELRNDKIYVAPAAGGPLRKLLGGWDHSAGTPAWSADSQTLYFTEGLGVDQHVFSVSVADGKLTQLTREHGVVAGPGYDYESGAFLISFTDPAHPADYYVTKPENIGRRSSWVRVSRANPQADHFALASYEAIHWKSSDGRTVEGILALPLGYEKGKKYPLIVQIHGGPASASLFAFSGGFGSYINVFAANGYAVLQPNYRGSDNYGETFRMQIAGDYFRQGFDDIMTGVDDVITQGIADPDKLGMMGWSAGGHWSDWTLTHTNRFKAISTGAGAVNWISMYAQSDIQHNREFYFKGKPWENWDHYVSVSPLRYITNARTPTLIHVGDADQRVPKPQSDELFMALKKLDVPVEYIVYPGMPHGISEPRYQMVKMFAEFNWFEKWIKGKPGWFDWNTLLATLDEPKSGEEKKSAPAGDALPQPN
jgi:dipeptidyl aminopeptidase/acylaminoacyl peptidase